MLFIFCLSVVDKQPFLFIRKHTRYLEIKGTYAGLALILHGINGHLHCAFEYQYISL